VLSGGHCRGEELSRLLGSDHLAGLRRLALPGALTQDDLDRLRRSPVLPNLERLRLSLDQEVTEQALEAFFGSARLERLVRLEVQARAAAPACFEALARSPASSRLRELSFSRIDEAIALTEGETFPDLHTLSVGWVDPSEAPALAALLESPKLPRLCVVQFSAYNTDLPKIAPLFRSCGRIAWAGGEMPDADGGDPTHVAVKPDDVYLPNHLEDLRGPRS
jgi:hypothetical protein